MTLVKRFSLILIPLLLFSAVLPFVTVEKAYAAVGLEVFANPKDRGVFWVDGVLYEGYETHAQNNYAMYDTVVLEAMPDQYSTFEYWEDFTSGATWYTPSIAIDLDKGYTVMVAHFAETPPIVYPLTVYSNPPAYGEVYCDVLGSYWDTFLYNPNIPESTDVYIEASPYYGYQFMGWYDGMGGWITDSNPYSFTLPDGGWGIYALFEAGYTVHIEPNGGTGYMPDPALEYGAEYTLPECDFAAPAGKEFNGWDVGDPGEKITIYGETWIYAQWKDATVYHLVYIDPNGGGGFMLDPWIEHGETYTLPESDFIAPEGKEFAGWDVGQPGEKITVNADMSIYAQWKDIAPASSDTSSSSAASSGSAASSEAASASSEAASSGSAASTESASSSASATSSTSAASSGASSTDASTSSASGSSATSGTGSGTSGTGSGGSGSSGGELPILPIAGGVIVGAGIVAGIAALVSRRKKEDDDDDGDDGPTKGAHVQPAQQAAAPTEPIAAAATAPVAQQPTVKLPEEEEGFDD